MMNQQQFQTQWAALQPKIKQKWTKFTDQDLRQVNGQRDKFIVQLQQKYGINKEQAEKELVELGRVLSGSPTGAGAGATGKKPTAGYNPNPINKNPKSK